MLYIYNIQHMSIKKKGTYAIISMLIYNNLVNLKEGLL